MFKGLLDTYIAAQFVRILSTPWKDTQAFKLGIIDAEGNILRPRSSLLTTEEKSAYTMFHRLVWNIKRILEKIPGGSTRLGSFAAAMYLLKESCANRMEDPSLLTETLLDYIEESGIETKGVKLSEALMNPVLPAGTLYVIGEDEYGCLAEDTKPVDWVFGVPVYKVDGVVFTAEDTTTAGIDMTDKGMTFAGSQVFNVSPDTFHRSRMGKRRFHRYDRYVGADEDGEKIRAFGRANPKHGIVLMNNQTKAMLYLRRPST